MKRKKTIIYEELLEISDYKKEKINLIEGNDKSFFILYLFIFIFGIMLTLASIK